MCLYIVSLSFALGLGILGYDQMKHIYEDLDRSSIISSFKNFCVRKCYGGICECVGGRGDQHEFPGGRIRKTMKLL